MAEHREATTNLVLNDMLKIRQNLVSAIFIFISLLYTLVSHYFKNPHYLSAH